MDRAQLSEILTDMISLYTTDERKHVFYQSPASYQMTYPSIIYSFQDYHKVYADNGTYMMKRKYQIMLISRDPDIELREELVKLPLCDMDRTYTADNLYHYIYTIYC